MIPFNKASITELEKEYMAKAVDKKICGDGDFTRLAACALEKKLNINNLLITTSCSHALDMAAMLLNIKEGDEVIMPSYTFVSTANAFALRGAKIVFCDIESDTLNMDVSKITNLITNKTKVIVPVHYAGSICDMDKINDIAKEHNLFVVEDAAQAVGNYYKGKSAGTLSDIGCYSFHETKNIVMGEGGAIVLRNEELFKSAEIIREKGTDRSLFLRGQVDKYTWRTIGSSYLPSDILCAILYAQVQRFDEIMNKRKSIWQTYYDKLESLEKVGVISRQVIPSYSTNNAHMFYFLLKSTDKRNELLKFLNLNNIMATFHYIPLHNSPMGLKLSSKLLKLESTEDCASRILRLPLYYDLNAEQVDYIINKVYDFFR